MSLPRSTFYAAPNGGRRAARAAADAALRADIEAVLADWPAYGHRRVAEELARRGAAVNRKRVARVMRAQALTRPKVRRFVAPGPAGAPDAAHFSNRVPGLAVTGPNRRWVADLTYIRLAHDFVFLAVVLDAWSRKVVGYAVGTSLETRLPLAALDAALASRRPAPGLVHHSDRGVQYASAAYRARLTEHGVEGSMSRPGTPTDNAYAEAFMKTLEHEEVYLAGYSDLQDVVDRLPRFLDDVYNRRRLHSALGYRPPDEFEAAHALPRAA